MIRAIAGALAAVALGACTVGQLSQFKHWEAAKDYTAIESKSIDAGCFGGQPSEECTQLAEIQGRACLTLARQESAASAACPPPSATAARRLACAAQDFDVAGHGTNFSAADKADFVEMRARALYCGANLKSRADGLPDARAALAALDTLPPSAERDQLAASASLYAANTDSLSSAERCAAARAAASRAARGLSENPSTEMRQGLADARGTAARIAIHLGQCPLE